MTEQQPNPTDAEIAAAKEINDLVIFQTSDADWPHIIAKFNRPLHAKLEKQKAALELAQTMMEDGWDSAEDDYCRCCCYPKRGQHKEDCGLASTRVAIKEALR